MSGLLSWLSPALTAGTEAVNAVQQGNEAASKKREGDTLKMIQLLQQKHTQENADQLQAANINHLNAGADHFAAQADQLRHPQTAKPEVQFDGGGNPFSVGNDGQLHRMSVANDAPPSGGAPTSDEAPPSLTIPQAAGGFVPRAPKETAPLPGSPAWIATKKQEAQILHSYDRPDPAQLTDIDDPAHPGRKIKGIFDPRSRTITPTDFGSPQATAAGGQTRLPERTQQLGLALSNAVEALPYHDEKAVAKPAGLLPSMAEGYLAGHSQAGSQPARVALNATKGGQTYERYIDAMNGSLLAVAHSVGGARISKEQTLMFGGNMMLTPNDPPETIKQKTRAIIDFMNAARITLPPDAVAKQEALLDPKGLAYLQSKGYGAAPSEAAKARVVQLRVLGGGDGSDTETAPPGRAGGPGGVHPLVNKYGLNVPGRP